MNRIKAWLYRICFKLRWGRLAAKVIRNRDKPVTLKELTTSTSKGSDHPVIRNFLEGDEKAFRELFDQYAPAIYRVVRRFLGSSDQSEELLGELFSSLWNEPERFDTSTMEKFKISLFERAKTLAKQKMGLPL